MKTRSATWDANCSVRFSTQDSGGLKMFCITVHMKCSDAFRFRHSRQDQKLDASKTIPLSRKGHWRSNPKIARLVKVKKSTKLLLERPLTGQIEARQNNGCFQNNFFLKERPLMEQSKNFKTRLKKEKCHTASNTIPFSWKGHWWGNLRQDQKMDASKIHDIL